MITKTATEARYNFFKLLKKTVNGHLQTKITTKYGNAILISENDYSSLLETAKLLSIPGLKESLEQADKDIVNGDVHSFEEIFE